MEDDFPKWENRQDCSDDDNQKIREREKVGAIRENESAEINAIERVKLRGKESKCRFVSVCVSECEGIRTGGNKRGKRVNTKIRRVCVTSGEI